MSSPLLRRLIVVASLLAILFGAQTNPAMPIIGAARAVAADGCYSIPKSANSPTGIAGCVRSGPGIASYYGPGNGVAMNFCTWTRRHTKGCGRVTITSLETGRRVTVPVVDFCDCYTGTSHERIVDLQTGVLHTLGLSPSRGLYKVDVEPANGAPATSPRPKSTPTPTPSATPQASPNPALQAEIDDSRALDAGDLTGSSWRPAWYAEAMRYLCWELATDAVDPICS